MKYILFGLLLVFTLTLVSVDCAPLTKQCVTCRKANQNCSVDGDLCPSGYQCVQKPDTSYSVCTPKLTIGSLNCSDARKCQDYLSCETVASTTKCLIVANKGLGESCDTDRDCDPSLKCDGTNLTCINPSNPNCTDDNHCKASERCYDKKCMTSFPDGKACNSSSQCLRYSNCEITTQSQNYTVCNGLFTLSEGLACTNMLSCDLTQGLTCYNDFCTKRPANSNCTLPFMAKCNSMQSCTCEGETWAGTCRDIIPQNSKSQQFILNFVDCIYKSTCPMVLLDKPNSCLTQQCGFLVTNTSLYVDQCAPSQPTTTTTTTTTPATTATTLVTTSPATTSATTSTSATTTTTMTSTTTGGHPNNAMSLIVAPTMILMTIIISLLLL
ncbi:hypothetical protein SAMD00019534_075490 [Acytostelium subglobosum LB1]|uniref:hypothetical protein n=1 Tax=Acytostelium subglobosum LB1 TaxID=1410327 RepID=UPI0006448A0F|nr:hypothetical protein SAMD00019534_075490 [Acytostelium subglobosum LB1]GAM24374.1 hypothetical protein SAMD00019534_075490 [Acytostelium subglobosum LB1]|eukprot:XP_012752700.1 hypothetical protein SAMD00019534_075490 [Acytostelium subglobosum LB1]